MFDKGRGSCVYRLLQLTVRHLAGLVLDPVTAVPTRASRLHNAQSVS